MRRLEAQSKKFNRNIEKITVVFDLKNISYMPDSMAFRAFHKFLKIGELYYPEHLNVLLMINAPWFFTKIWAIIHPWLDSTTAKKINILGTDFHSKLREYIDESNVPVELGGLMNNCIWHRPWPLESGCSSIDIKNYLECKNIS